MEENHNRDEQEAPTPLTDEDFARLHKKQKRQSVILVDILDFILSFFH